MTHPAATTGTLDAAQVLDMYFLEARARLIELAAALAQPLIPGAC